MSQVFLSYAHSDKAAVDVLAAMLGEHIAVWIDDRELHPASRFMDVIVPAIHEAEAFIFAFSANSVSSEYCVRELACAYESGTKIIPVWLTPAKLVPVLPSQIDGLTGITWDADPASVDRLLEAIRTDAAWHQSRKRLLTAAMRWAAQGEDRTDLLFRGTAITEALDVIAEARAVSVDVLDEELRFAAASQALEAADLARERELRQRAVARQLAAEAELLLQTRPAALDLAVLLAIESSHCSHGLQSSHVLRAGLHLLPRRHSAASHGAPVRACCFDASGSRAATAGEDGSARVWDTAAGNVICMVEHGAVVLAVAFQTSGRLITAGGDNTVRVWDIGTGAELRRVQVDATAVAITPDGAYACWAARDGTAVVCNLNQGSSVMLKHDHRVAAVGLSPDGTVAATYSNSPLHLSRPRTESVRLWNVLEGSWTELKKRFVSAFVFSPSGTYVAVDGLGGLQVWDVESCRLLSSLQGHLPAVFSSSEKAIAFRAGRRASPAGGTLASDAVLAVARVENGELLRTWNEEEPIAAIEFCRGHDYVAAAVGRMVRVWETDTGREVSRLPHSSKVRHVVYSHSGRTMLTVTQNGDIASWQLPMDAAQLLDRFDGTIADIAASPNGRYLALYALHNVIVFDCLTGIRIVNHGREGNVRSLKIADDGSVVAVTEPTRVLSSGGAHDSGAWGFLILSASTGRTWIPQQRTAAVAITHSGDFVAVADGATVQLWSGRTRTQINQWELTGAVNRLVFDAEGTRLCIAGASTLWVCDLQSPANSPRLVITHGGIADITFDAEDRCVVLGSSGQISVIDPAAGDVIASFDSGHPFSSVQGGPSSQTILLSAPDRSALYSIASATADFTVRHEQLLATSGDRGRIALLDGQRREIRIHNLVEQRIEARMYCHRTAFRHAAFIAGNRLAMADDGGMHTEPIAEELLEVELMKRLGRQLTEDECQRYLED